MKLPSGALNLKNAFFLGSRHSFISTCYEHGLICKNKAFLSYFSQNSQFHAYPYRFLGFQSIINNTQKLNWLPFSVEAVISSRVRHFSTSVETGIKDKNFERTCVQNVVNVKPLVEIIENDKNLVGESPPVEDVNKVKNVGDGLEEGRSGVLVDSHIEKAAWNLLRDAVVTYCGYPVGTLAANDPGDKQPLNYDQVFIRDFVPSALAFLLKGEGEIVKNFPLHTLQLQNQAILNLIETKWDDIVGHMPLKIIYPAVENEEWRMITGSDPKNTPWSYHNGGSWPTLLWQFTLACVKMGILELAQKAIALAEKRPSIDRWPEYYDTRNGKFIGKQSRLYQTWTIAGFLTSKMMVENPQMASLLFWEEDYELLEICGCAHSKSGRINCSRGAAKSQILV